MKKLLQIAVEIAPIWCKNYTKLMRCSKGSPAIHPLAKLVITKITSLYAIKIIKIKSILWSHYYTNAHLRTVNIQVRHTIYEGFTMCTLRLTTQCTTLLTIGGLQFFIAHKSLYCEGIIHRAVQPGVQIAKLFDNCIKPPKHDKKKVTL